MATRVSKRLSLPVDKAKEPLASPKSGSSTTLSRKRSWRGRKKKSTDTALENSALEELFVVLVEDEIQSVARALVAQLQAYEMATAGGALMRILAREQRGRELVAWALQRAGKSSGGVGEFWVKDNVRAIPGGSEAAWWLLLREALLLSGGDLLLPWLQENLSAAVAQKEGRLLVDNASPPWYQGTTGIACPKPAYNHEQRATLMPVLLKMIAKLVALLHGPLPATFLRVLADCAFSPLISGAQEEKSASKKRSRPCERSKTFLLRAIVVAYAMPAICRMTSIEVPQRELGETLVQCGQLLRDLLLNDYKSLKAEGVFKHCQRSDAKEVLRLLKETIADDLLPRLQALAGEKEVREDRKEEVCEPEQSIEEDLILVKDTISAHLPALWPDFLSSPYGRILLQIFAKQGLRKVDL